MGKNNVGKTWDCEGPVCECLQRGFLSEPHGALKNYCRPPRSFCLCGSSRSIFTTFKNILRHCFKNNNTPSTHQQKIAKQRNEIKFSKTKNLNEDWHCVTFLNLLNIWLDGRQLDSYIFFCIQPTSISCLVGACEENSSLHWYEVGKREKEYVSSLVR